MEIYLRKVKTKRRVFSELNNLKIVLEKFTILTLNSLGLLTSGNSVTRRPDYLSIFGHLQQGKIAQ